jgi:16S rRNA (cytosine1402-N4)-methyltransferase
MDLGLCSAQIENPDRGFSLKRAGPLDMRMNLAHGEPASALINELSETALADLFFKYGEERRSRRIARAIAQRRRQKRIETTQELAELVRRAIPRTRSWHRIDPATRVFQALRIAVNDELESLKLALSALPACLKPGGKGVIISFHSLEDRLVKSEFRRREIWEPLTKKPLTPTRSEIERNRRARSAKLRAARLK